MARLIKDLPGAEPVDRSGTSMGPAATLHAGTEFSITISKLRRQSDDLEVFWCELKVGEQLYRVRRRTLEAVAAV
jgi:hypothetical protein